MFFEDSGNRRPIRDPDDWTKGLICQSILHWDEEMWECCVSAVGRGILKMIPNPVTKNFSKGWASCYIVFRDLCKLEHCLGVEGSKNE